MTPTARSALVLAALCAGCASTNPVPTPLPSAPVIRSIPLPGAPAEGGIPMDVIAYDRAHHRLWVPAGNTGSVDVIDVPGDHLTRIEGFPTKTVERNGKQRTVGPSSVTIAGDTVFVGNRGDSSVCALDAVSLAKGACLVLDASPDLVAYVPATKEVWVTTPGDKSIRVLDAATPGTLTAKAKIACAGEPEGLAVDEARGVVFTNLEDADRTLAIDVRTRQVTHEWKPECGEDGPKGLAFDGSLDVLFVACPDHVIALDAAHDGARLGALPVGDGIDLIDYDESTRSLYVGAGKAAVLVVAHVEAPGALAARATVPTKAGARNGVAAEDGSTYLVDSKGAAILAVGAATTR